MGTESKERRAWGKLMSRCYNPRNKDFKRYGGAGITVCPEWRTSYAQFLNDVGRAPSRTHWLGRLDVRKGYYPANVIWTTQPEQQRRRAFCRKVTLCGREMTAAEAARLPGQPCRKQVLRRQKNGLLFDNPPSASMHPKAHWITHNGLSLPLYEWAKRLGLRRETLSYRLKQGLPPEQVLHPGRLPMRRPSSIPLLAR